MRYPRNIEVVDHTDGPSTDEPKVVTVVDHSDGKPGNLRDELTARTGQ